MKIRICCPVPGSILYLKTIRKTKAWICLPCNQVGLGLPRHPAPAFVDLNAELEEAGEVLPFLAEAFAVVASAGGGGVASAGTPSVSAGGTSDSSGDGGDSSGDSSESGGEREGDGDGDGDSQGEGSASKSASRPCSRDKQAWLFAPISQPILSVEASEILERALAPEVEQRMEKYLLIHNVRCFS